MGWARIDVIGGWCEGWIYLSILPTIRLILDQRKPIMSLSCWWFTRWVPGLLGFTWARCKNFSVQWNHYCLCWNVSILQKYVHASVMVSMCSYHCKCVVTCIEKKGNKRKIFMRRSAYMLHIHCHSFFYRYYDAQLL